MTSQGTATASTPTTTSLPLKPGRWVIDQDHSGIAFSIRHLGLSKVRGRFTRFDAWLDVGTSLADTKVEAVIEMASVDTSQADRDQHLLGADFFYVEKYPEMRFTSTQITGDGDKWHLEGEVTILGETHPFDFDVEFNGLQDFEIPEHKDRRAGFEVAGQLKRSELGLDFGIPASAGILLGDAVKFELDLQFVEPTS